MSELEPCAACYRHIRVSESACPFCETQNLNRSRLGSARTVILTGALMGASVLGCSDERPATKAPPPVAETPVVVAIDAAAPDPIDAAVPKSLDASAPAAADAAVAKKSTKKRVKKTEPALKQADRVPRDMDVQMPYGAPPARHRLV